MRIDCKDRVTTGVDGVFECRHWYLAQLRPNGFERAVLNLNRQNYPTFMPMRETTRRRQGKLMPAQHPLFPGYVFTRIVPERRDWRSVNATYGVSRLVALRAGLPAEVPPGLMAALWERTDAGGMMTAPQDLVPGDSVRIISGPFAQQVAEIEAVKPGDRVIVLLDLMGRSVRTQARSGQLEVI